MGGSIFFIETVGSSSTINVSGGRILSGLSADTHSTVNIYGGSIGDLYAVDHGTLNLYGMGLSKTLINPNNGYYSQYAISGTLADGTRVNNETLYFWNGSFAKVNFITTAVVPEPSSVALFVCLVGMSLFARKRLYTFRAVPSATVAIAPAGL